jgi:hypothetical protein
MSQEIRMKSSFLWVVLATAVLGTAEEPQDPDRSRARAEAQVKADLARRKDAAPDAVSVVEVAERTWPDERLGCLGRRGTLDPVPVPGYRIVLALGDRRYVYHADREGRFVPCDRPPKPINPIR